MQRILLVFLLLAGGCAESAQQASPDKAPAAPPPAGTPAATPAPAASGPTCAGEVCKPPGECMHYSGMVEGVTSVGCYIPCANGKACPHGMSCIMMHDGPGEICEPSK